MQSRMLRQMAVALCLSASVPLASAALANGETDPIPYWTIPVSTDSGAIEGVGEGMKPVFRQEVASGGAPWVRVIFDPSMTELNGPTRGPGATVMRITSLQDGHVQLLNKDTLEQWGYSTAYFNGEAVEIEIFAAEGHECRVAVLEVQAGLIPDGQVASICGPTDDRVASTEARVGRIMPVGCTAWLFDGKPNAMLSAGHCFDATTATVVQFNVPLSTAGGATVNPPPSDQYAIDATSIQFANVAIGNDWAHFGVFANSTTGFAPLVRQGSSFQTNAAAATTTIRITGFGVDDGTANQTNQTHAGPYDSLVGTIIRYRADTTGGNSGSPIIRESDGRSMGIHTNAGCGNSGGTVTGANQGTTMGNTGLANAIANPLGVAAATTACGLGEGSCFVARSTPHCADASCCTAVCTEDPFCCNTQWDAICVNRALQVCGGCGASAPSCYTSHATAGCTDIACCGTICPIDPFCCNTSWDGLCVARAESTCRTGDTCADAIALNSSYTASFGFNTNDGVVDSTGNCFTSASKATWRKWTASCNGLATASICTEFYSGPIYISVYDACGGNRLVCTQNASPSDCGLGSGGTVEALFGCVASRTYYIRIQTQGDATTAVGTIGITCAPVCGVGGSCLATSVGPGCADANCCATVCSLDPFCCENQWDALCVQGAQANCFKDGDLNYDGVVNAADLALMLGGWGGSGVADINGDGIANAADLSILLGNWG